LVLAQYATFDSGGSKPMTIEQARLDKKFQDLKAEFYALPKASYSSSIKNKLKEVVDLVTKEEVAEETVLKALDLFEEAFKIVTFPEDVASDFSESLKPLSKKVKNQIRLWHAISVIGRNKERAKSVTSLDRF